MRFLKTQEYKELSDMKKLICLLTVLALAMAFACPVFAAEAFVPSISDKEEPDIVPDDEGVIGEIWKDDEVIDKVEGGCLVITPISEAETSTEIPEDAREELLYVYKELLEGDMTLPYEQDGLDPETMVIRELIDASWLCEDHPAMLEPEGVTIDLTFDIGVDADTKVYVYVRIDGVWTAVPVINNGDGTVTCTFEELCPIAFCVAAGTGKPPVQTGDEFNPTIWIVLLAVSAAALVGVVVLRRKLVK
jgi:hypothetical protein